MPEALHKSACSLGEGCIFEARELLPPGLLSRLAAYKQNVARSYATILSENIARYLPQERFFISTKIDGEQWFLHKNGHGSLLVSPSGKAIAGLPVTEVADAILGTWTGLFAGELFAQPEAGRARLCELHAALGNGAAAPVERLRFAAFDLLQDGAINAESRSFEWRVKRLRNLLLADGLVRVVDFQKAHSLEAVTVFYEKQVAAGEEGIVARTAEGRAFKIKPRLTLDVAIIAWTEASGGVGEVLLALRGPDGATFQSIGRVDTGFRNSERRILADQLRALSCEAPLHLASRSGRPLQWVRPEIVVEIECQEILAQRSEGAPIRRWQLDWKDGAWAPIGKRPAASLRHAVFKRMRPDKKAAGRDIRWEQLGVSVDEKTRASLPSSELLAREAYAKLTRHGLAVRKCVIWKTRKETRDPRYSSFCAFFTDYTPNRGEPLLTELRVAASQDKILEIASAWRDAKIGRGWKRMAAQGKVVPCENSHTATIEKAHSGGARLTIAFGRSASPAFPVVRRRLDNLAGLGALKIEAEQAGREVWFELRVEKGLVEHYRRIANLLQLVRRWKSLEVTADGEVLDPFTIDSLMNRLGEIRQCWQRRKQGGAAACRKEDGLGCRMVNLAPSERFLTGARTSLPPWHAVGRFENGALVIDKDGLRQQLGRRTNRLLRECPLFDCGAVDAAIDALPENLEPDGVNYRAVCRRSDGLVVWVWPAHLPLPPGLTMRSDGRTEGDVETTGSVAATASRVLPPTTYAHVCGQDTAVEAVRDLIELPLRHAELFASIGAAALPSGVILAGPPGTGKTLLARAVAGSCGCHLEIVSGPELLNPYVGATEKAIREVFQRARNHAPAIILFDELDSIAPTRATADAQHQRSVTAQLLTLLDGLETRKQVFALATTNRPEHIDPALRRPGRFDRVVWMGPPKHQGRNAILRHYLKPLHLAPEINQEALIRHLAENTRGASGADLQHLCQTAARICVKDIASQEPAPPSSAITQAHFLQALEEFTQLRKRR